MKSGYYSCQPGNEIIIRRPEIVWGFDRELFAGVLKESYKTLQLQAKSASHLYAYARQEREHQDSAPATGNSLAPCSTDLNFFMCSRTEDIWDSQWQPWEVFINQSVQRSVAALLKSVWQQ